MAESDFQNMVIITSPSKSKTGAVSKSVTQSTGRPRYEDMIVEAIKSLKERRGSSLQAIKKYMSATYQVDTVRNARFITKIILKVVENGTLVRTSGKGASGSFKVGAIVESSSKSVKGQTAETTKNTGAAGTGANSRPKKPAAVKESRLSLMTAGTRKRAKRDENVIANVKSKESQVTSEPKVVPKTVATVQPKTKQMSKKTSIKQPSKLVSAKSKKSVPSSDKTSGAVRAKQSAKKPASNLSKPSKATAKKPVAGKK